MCIGHFKIFWFLNIYFITKSLIFFLNIHYRSEEMGTPCAILVRDGEGLMCLFSGVLGEKSHCPCCQTRRVVENGMVSPLRSLGGGEVLGILNSHCIKGSTLCLPHPVTLKMVKSLQLDFCLIIKHDNLILRFY